MNEKKKKKKFQHCCHSQKNNTQSSDALNNYKGEYTRPLHAKPIIANYLYALDCGRSFR